MEYNWSLFNNSSNGSSSNYEVRGHDGNCVSNHAWDFYPLTYPQPPGGAFHALNPDPHLTCLKLGKRHYFEDATPPPPVVGPKKVKCEGEGGIRCQVEGCEAALAKAKEYHRRHKVCEMHAKAPRVVLHGIHQRFCQQCSRFHGVAEFDEAKRSCRRRLAGHNERRRKSSQEHISLARKHSQEMKMMGVRSREAENNSESCALSLLSSTPWNNNISTSPDLPARCSAALRELIAENRASLSACKHMISPRTGLGPHDTGGHVTLDLMQAPNSAFGLLSVHHHKSSKEEHGQDHCSDELWKLPLGY